MLSGSKFPNIDPVSFDETIVFVAMLLCVAFWSFIWGFDVLGDKCFVVNCCLSPMCIYIYIYRERERERDLSLFEKWRFMFGHIYPTRLICWRSCIYLLHDVLHYPHIFCLFHLHVEMVTRNILRNSHVRLHYFLCARTVSSDVMCTASMAYSFIGCVFFAFRVLSFIVIVDWLVRLKPIHIHQRQRI